MRRVFALSTLAAAFVMLPGAATAKDYGKAGPTWPIAEPDMLEVIKARLMALQNSGGLKAFEEKSVARAQESIRRPKAVEGIAHASENRTWIYDPTVTIGEDIRDGRGQIIAAKGQRFNPLDHVTVSHDLAFVDGDSPAEMEWVLQQGDAKKLMIVLVKGSPIDQMKLVKRRLYFDQMGQMTSRLGVTRTPAIARQKGKAMEITEYAINRSKDL